MSIRLGKVEIDPYLNITTYTNDSSVTLVPVIINATNELQTITPPVNVAYSNITVNPVTYAVDPNITAANIRAGITILGVTGTLPINVPNPIIYSRTQPENSSEGTIWLKPVEV